MATAVPARRARLQLAAVLVLAAAVRFIGLDAQSLSTDEVSEIDLAELPVGELLSADDGFPPLFHLLLKPLHGAVSPERASRLLAALLGTLTLWPMWALARRRLAPPAALLATLLLALSPFHVQLSRDGRVYALYVLCAAVALAAFERAVSTGEARAWWAFGLASAFGLAGHYYFGLLLVLLAGCALCDSALRARPAPPLLTYAALLVFSGALAACVLPPDLAHQTGYDGGPVSYRRPVDFYALGYAGFELLLGVGLGPSKSALHEIAPRAAVLAFAPWLLALLVPLLPAAAALARARPDRARRRFALLALLPPLLVAGASAALAIHFKTSYFAWSLLPLLLLLAHGLTTAAASRAVRISLAGSLLALQLLALVRAEVLPQYQREDLRSAARALTARGATAAVTNASYLAQPLGFYWPAGLFHFLPDVGCRGQNLERALARVEAQRANAPDGRAFLVSARPFHGDPCRVLRRALIARYATTVVHRATGVEVIALAAPGATARVTPAAAPPPRRRAARAGRRHPVRPPDASRWSTA